MVDAAPVPQTHRFMRPMRSSRTFTVKLSTNTQTDKMKRQVAEIDLAQPEALNLVEHRQEPQAVGPRGVLARREQVGDRHEHDQEKQEHERPDRRDDLVAW